MTAGLPDLARAGLRFDVDAPARGAATITLDNAARRNAMTPSLWHGLAAIGAVLPSQVRVVVVGGAGPSFSAGIDLRLFTPEGVPGEDPLPNAGDPGFDEWIASCQAGFSWLRNPAIVSVAAVRGHAIGGGFQLALACDIRVLADDAQLCMKEPALGLVPDLTGTKPLVDIVGLPRAIELCLTGRSVGAAEAAGLRLAELVVPGAELDATVGDLVAALLAVDPAVARATKELLQQAPANTADQQAAAERRVQTALQRARLALLARGGDPPGPPASRQFALSGPGKILARKEVAPLMYAANWHAMRGFSRDSSVTHQRIKPGTVRRIMSYAKPYRRELALFLGMTALSAVAVVAVPLLLRTIVNGVLASDTALVIGVAGVVAGLALVSALLAVAQRWYSARIGEGLIYDLRTQVFRHVQQQPIAFFTRAQTGSLVSRLNSDVIGAQQALTSTLSSVVSNALTLMLVLVAMFSLSWLVTVVALVLLPAFVIPARLIGRRLQRYTRESMQLDAAMGSTMTERFNVAGAMLVKLFGKPEQESEVFAGRAARVRDIGVVTAMYGGTLFIALTLLASMATAVVYGLGGTLVIHHAFQLGTLVALTALLARLYGPITALSNVQVDVMTALVSFDRVFEVLDLEPLIQEKPGAVPLRSAPSTGAPSGNGLPSAAPAVDFDHVSFHYPAASEVSLASLESIALPVPEQAGPAQPVLREVSFTAPPGQLTALVGPSGAGKTTITHLVSRLYDPDQGAVRIGSQDLRDVTLDSLHDAVGVVTQDAHMFHDTIRANLSYARPGATEAELVAACRAAQIWELIAALPDGLDTVVGDRGYRLSGGEKQRLAIARLLLKAPSVVVLDEATAHLDSESEAAVQAALKTALTGRTSLVIAHRLSTIREADQILVVDEGQVRERGSHLELLAADGLYAELYHTQFAGQEPAPAP